MSTPMSAEALTQELVRRQLIEPNAPPVPPKSHRPWFISVVLGFAGWLAGLFIMAFVATLIETDSTAAMTFAGLLLLASAFGLYTVDRNSEFFDQLALALSIGGQLALVIAVAEETNSEARIAAFACSSSAPVRPRTWPESWLHIQPCP